MDTRTLGRNGLAVFSIVALLGLVGCDSVYTIHSIAGPTDQPSAVPDVSGLWVQNVGDSTGGVLRVSEAEYDVGQCRNATVYSLGLTSIDDETVAGEICFVPVAGHLIFQLRTTGQVQLYKQYLFRFDKASVSFCGAVWSDLLEWSDHHLSGTAAHGLEFMRRGAGDSTELFVTSRRSELLSYLEATLSKAVQACDEADEDGSSGWVTYHRVTPLRQPDPAGAVGDLPSPPD
jgi:hypothetical protein